MKKVKQKVIKDLAEYFEQDLKKTLPISIQPNGSIVYKNYMISPLVNGNWILKNKSSIDKLDEFYLKTTALLAAKAYDKTNFNDYNEIKRLDTKYWSKHSDLEICRKNIKKAKDLDHFLILLNKLENTESESELYKNKISQMFKYNFV